MKVNAYVHAPADLPGKESPVPLDRKLGGPQSRSGRCKEEKKISCPYRESNPSRSARRTSRYTDLIILASYPVGTDRSFHIHLHGVVINK
jgi:hypothetical protein